MARLFRTLIVAAAVAGLSLPALASSEWHRSNMTLPQALVAGYRVIDTYHNEQGHLFFVLQFDSRLLICQFHEQQTELCVALFPDR
jgi:hypothetical protein